MAKSNKVQAPSTPAATPSPKVVLYKLAIKAPRLRKPHTKAAWDHLTALKGIATKGVSMADMEAHMVNHKWSGTKAYIAKGGEQTDHTCFPGYAERSKWLTIVK